MPVHFRYENPFNVLALLISRLPELSAELYQSRDKRDALAPTADWDSEVQGLLSALPEFHDVDNLLKDGIPPGALAQLKTWCETNNTFSPILSLICGLDHKLYWNNILKSSYLSVGLKDGFEALNDNWNETGILMLPRVPSLNDPLDRAGINPDSPGKTWAYAWDPGINEELTNTYYVEKDKLTVNNKQYKVIHKVVTNWMAGGSILFAVSPISKDAQLQDPSCYKSGRYHHFSIDGLADPDYVCRRVKAAYRKAVEEGASFLIFPEMLGDKSMFDPDGSASDFFSQLGEEAEKAKYSGPALILPPTWWHDKRNQLHVIGGDGGYICVQEKQNSFLYHCDKTGEDHLEDLENTLPSIQVLHIPYVGRITFPICKDYLVVSYRELLARTLRSTLMLCPSYSKGKFSFCISAPAELEYGCYTLWINTCSARPDKAPPPYVGLVAAPNAAPVSYLTPECCGQCGSADDPCLFLVEIKRTGEAPEITVRGHICPHAKQPEKEEIHE